MASKYEVGISITDKLGGDACWDMSSLFVRAIFALIGLCSAFAVAAQPAPLPPPPMPVRTNVFARPFVAPPLYPGDQRQFGPASVPLSPLVPANRFGTAAQPIQPVQGVQPPAKLQPASYLAWDAEQKETNAPPGVPSVHFRFWLTNTSPEEVLINSVRTSCGCTVAQLPASPWRVTPGTNGPIDVTVNVQGKFGTITKSVMVDGSTGTKTLLVVVTMPSPATVASAMDADRMKNMQMAMADRQAVFKGECAKCHAEAGFAKSGEELYMADCGICHDVAHRAALVPDLHALAHPTSPEHWRKWIIDGRQGSMMPAFAKAQGGPLSDEQIDSLVKYLTEAITDKAKPAPLPTVKPILGFRNVRRDFKTD